METDYIDDNLFDDFIKFYEQMSGESSRFVYLLTIQNHGNGIQTKSIVI